MIHTIINFFHQLTDPEQLIKLLTSVFEGGWGYLVLCGIIFAETGLLFGFILPGDSLLFTVGAVAGAGGINVYLIMFLLVFAVLLGDNLGYYLGRRTGPVIFSRPDSLLFKKNHVVKTQEFFDRHGAKTIMFARFLPVIRSFAPFMAGVGGMKYRSFLAYSFVGGLFWVITLTLAGYFFGNIQIVKDNFEKVILIVVALSFMPMVYEILKSKLRKA